MLDSSCDPKYVDTHDVESYMATSMPSSVQSTTWNALIFDREDELLELARPTGALLESTNTVQRVQKFKLTVPAHVFTSSLFIKFGLGYKAVSQLIQDIPSTCGTMIE